MMSTPWLKLSDIKTPRWSKANNGRTIPLNTAAWAKLRAHILDDEPLCRHCAALGLTVVATDVDHMRGAGDNARDALQSLCHSCHSRKTAQEMGGNVAMGCDKAGKPLDPSHHWNVPQRAVLLHPRAETEKIASDLGPSTVVSPLFNANPESVA